jgi:predicted Fe-Mo cluster-binding NifX family protein
MRIAVPLFKERVSPHFGSSSTVLVVDVQDGVICRKAVVDVGGETPLGIARRLVELGVDRLLCGGIQTRCKEWLFHQGVAVVDNQMGVADEVVWQMVQGASKHRKGA